MQSVTEACSKDTLLKIVIRRDAKGVDASVSGLNVGQRKGGKFPSLHKIVKTEA